MGIGDYCRHGKFYRCEQCDTEDAVSHDRQQRWADETQLRKDAALGAVIRKYFTSGNSIAVERATILRKDIAHLLDNNTTSP